MKPERNSGIRWSAWLGGVTEWMDGWSYYAQLIAENKWLRLRIFIAELRLGFREFCFQELVLGFKLSDSVFIRRASDGLKLFQFFFQRLFFHKRDNERPNDQAQRPPSETPGRLQQSLPNYLNRPTAQRGGGSLQRSG